MPSDPDTLLAAWLADRDDPTARAALAEACVADRALARRARALQALDGLLALRLRGLTAIGFRAALDERMAVLAAADFRRGVLRALPRQRSPTVRWVAMVAAAALAIATLLWWAPWTPVPFASVIADAGEHNLALPGGGQLTMLPGSAWLPTTEGGRLQAGAVDLDVATRSGSPFRAGLGDAEVIVLGTQFRLRRQGSAGSVLLERGRITVERGTERWTLAAGEAIDLAATPVRHGLLLHDGWSASPGPQEMLCRPTPPATLTFTAPASQGEAWALAERSVDGLGTVTLLASGSGAPGTSWGLVASERDGDAWLLGGDQLAAIPVPILRGWWPGVPPHKRLAANGDGRFDPASVVRLGLSVSGGAGTLIVQELVSWR